MSTPFSTACHEVRKGQFLVGEWLLLHFLMIIWWLWRELTTYQCVPRLEGTPVWCVPLLSSHHPTCLELVLILLILALYRMSVPGFVIRSAIMPVVGIACVDEAYTVTWVLCILSLYLQPMTSQNEESSGFSIAKLQISGGIPSISTWIWFRLGVLWYL